MIVEGFIFLAYVLGTAFGFYWGLARGQKNGIIDTVDSLIEQGYLRWKGHKQNPEIMKWNDNE